MKNRAIVLAGSWLSLAGGLFLSSPTGLIADNGPDHQAIQSRPISLGTSGGNINDSSLIYCCSGTLGSLVQDADGIQYILSNNHVLGRANQAQPGEPVNQPGMIDQSCQTQGIIATFSRLVPLEYAKGRTVPLNHVDAAIAEVMNGTVRTDGNILDIGGVSGSVMAASLGQTVQKSGRTTGHTFGTVNAVDVTVDVGYSKECGGAANQRARFVNQFSVSDGNFSAGGDSGSLIVETAAGGTDGLPRAVGLLFAGSDVSTIANPIGDVLSALNVTMVAGTPPPATVGRVGGIVIDAATGAPISGATVTADSGQSFTTVGDGLYTIDGVPTGTRTITASATGYASAAQVVIVYENQLTAADTFSLEVQTGPTQAIAECIIYNLTGGKNNDRNILITVRVIDELGNPVPSATVGITVTADGALFGSGSASTDGNGQVTFSGRNAPNATYVTTVDLISKAGLTFEGSTPLNAFQKGKDSVPASYCRQGATGQAVPQIAGLAVGSFNAIRQIKARHSDALFALPNVVGHGIGLGGGQPVIEVYLAADDAAARAQIPAALDGVPVRVVVTGPFTAY